MERERRSWKGLAAGALGGLAGTIVMTGFQNAVACRKEPSGHAVHYATGVVNGALYGMLAEQLETSGAGAGLLFGSGLWALGGEIAVPAHVPWKYRSSIHAAALARLVYGATTWAVAKGIRALL